MKYTKFVSLALLFAVIFTSITACSMSSYTQNDADDQKNQDLTSQKNTRPDRSDEKAPKKNTVFLMSFPEGQDGEKIDGFDTVSRHGLYTKDSTKIFDDLKGKSKTNPFKTSDTLEYKYSRIITDSFSGISGSYYSVYDVYESSHETVEYLHGTDMLCFYSNSEKHSGESVVDVYSEEKAQSVAREFLLRFMSEKELDGYKVESVSSSSLFMCSVHYARYIGDYRTDDVLSVFIDRYGKADGFNGKNMKKYDGISDTFTLDDLNASAEILTKKLADSNLKNINMHSPTITTDINGKVYLEIRFSYEAEIVNVGAIAFINVN